MKNKELVRAIKFIFFSMGAGIIETVVFTLLNEFVTDQYWYAYLPALVLSVVYNFTLNRKFTFKAANNVPVAMLKVAAFYAVFTPLSTWCGNIMFENWHWNEYLVLAITMAINLSTEFLYQKFFVFRNAIDTNDIAQKEKEKNI